MDDFIPNRFDGQRAIVTGGSSGLGRGIADRLSAEGAEVEVWDIQPCDAHAFRRVDVTDWSAVRTAMTDFGTPDAVIASAGMNGPVAPVVDYPIEDWHAVFNLNIHGVFHTLRAAARQMSVVGYGRMVAIASIAGKEGNPNAAAYSSSKAAVIGLVKSLGKELAETGVTVNAIAPAAVETPIFLQMTEAHVSYMKSKIPMGRLGRVEEIASIACWLASREASFSTGACFDASGGRATY